MILIRFLLISICILYIIRSLVRHLLPVLFEGLVNKAQQQYQQQQQNYSQGPKPDGKLRIDHVPQPKKGSVPDSEGEFVDYEEVK
ncbi:DUF4834 family protein [Mucilaginibacter celer]|uniref:DUF4834 family protein n=1 Tax=Mucilaginibacter celer TaxID=2305508 RepID=A0A494VPT2_9SPHI|nr:DUF4834 family protein [Mucilaginibacter celer]AYL97506.1 DUF4834 family protein [Mucilaginibacter celer]